jgi:hypothetical protein
MQPINRPAFKRTQLLAPYPKRTQPIARLIDDLPAVVASRRLGLDGDDQERRLARCTSIYWDPRMPQLDGAPRVPPLSRAGGAAAGAGEAEDDEDVASDAGFTPGFTPPTAVHWLGCGYAGSLCPKREDFDPLALGMYAGPRLPPWALLRTLRDTLTLALEDGSLHESGPAVVVADKATRASLAAALAGEQAVTVVLSAGGAFIGFTAA